VAKKYEKKMRKGNEYVIGINKRKKDRIKT
jgi:hypothetical protein